jgi:hypothetical protein
VIDRVVSKSYITAQTAEEQAKIGRNVVAILNEGQDRKWIDEEQGIFGESSLGVDNGWARQFR